MIKCELCGRELHYSDEIFATDTGGFVCSECYGDKHPDKCHDCNRLITTKRGCLCICETSDIGVHEYSYKPKGLYKTELEQYKYRHKERYYGMELEINNIGSNIAGNLFEKSIVNKDCYLKRDSSISNGVEIVTAPMGKKYMEKWLDSLGDVWKFFNDDDKLKEGAGLHIHVSKNSIPFESIVKLGLLTNSEEMNTVGDALAYIGRRYDDITCPSYSDYCRKSYKNIKNCLTTDHSASVNFSPIYTIEFRCFKSTTNVAYIKDYINIVDSTLSYVGETPIKDISLQSYLDWLYCSKGLSDDTRNRIKECGVLLNRDKTKLDLGSEAKKFVTNIKPEYYNWVIEMLSEGYSLKEVKRAFCDEQSHKADNIDLNCIDFQKLKAVDIGWISAFTETKIKEEEMNKERLWKLLCA